VTPVHWVIQENQADSIELRAIVEALEFDRHVPHLIPLKKGSEVPAIPDLPGNAPVVCQGPAFVPRALKYPRLRSGLFFDPATFRWSAFQAGWKEAMLSPDGRVMPLSTARNLLRDGTSAYIRPDCDSKAFDGRVYDSSGLVAVTSGMRVTDETEVVVSPPVDIEAEWHFFVVDKEIVGCSEYRQWGRVSTEGSVPYAVMDLAAQSASRWWPADVYCLDLASTGDRIGIVEANCFNASRFYGSVIDRILRGVNTYVLSRFEPI